MERIEHLELRKTSRFGHLAVGSLACSECDAPVALHRAASPAEPLDCPYCSHSAPLRDFLSLRQPTRPAHVTIRVKPAREARVEPTAAI